MCQTTVTGWRILGALIKQARESAGYSLRDFSALIESVVGVPIGASTLSTLERGGSSSSWNTIAAIAATEIVKSPDGHPYDTRELFMIACEKLNPQTGKIIDGADCQKQI